jgi:hypothetical protein
MYHSYRKRATTIIKKTGYNVIFLTLTKTFHFDDRLKIKICVTENNKEQHMLSHILSSWD